MIDWPANFREYNTLGLWHAIHHLKAISIIKDPYELAHDVVQEAWEVMIRRQTFSKALFITVIHTVASNAARDARPIEMHYKAGSRPGLKTKSLNGKRQRITGTFPVQVFATMLDEIDTPICGDE